MVFSSTFVSWNHHVSVTSWGGCSTYLCLLSLPGSPLAATVLNTNITIWPTETVTFNLGEDVDAIAECKSLLWNIKLCWGPSSACCICLFLFVMVQGELKCLTKCGRCIKILYILVYIYCLYSVCMYIIQYIVDKMKRIPPFHSSYVFSQLSLKINIFCMQKNFFQSFKKTSDC